MPEIEPADVSLKDLQGLHLWHAPLSSCSQRVRIVLSETGQAYESHLIDLERDEHASAAYQAVHPKGLVPALVHDGRLPKFRRPKNSRGARRRTLGSDWLTFLPPFSFHVAALKCYKKRLACHFGVFWLARRSNETQPLD